MTKTKDYSDITKVDTDKLRKILSVKQDHYRELSQEAEETYDSIVDIKIELQQRLANSVAEEDKKSGKRDIVNNTQKEVTKSVISGLYTYTETL